MKNVQIPYDLFVALVEYHLGYVDEYEDEVRQGLEQKLDALVRHEPVSYTHLAVLNTTSQTVSRSAPMRSPSKTVPSSRIKYAFMRASCFAFSV